MEYQTDSTYDGEYDALLDILNGICILLEATRMLDEIKAEVGEGE